MLKRVLKFFGLVAAEPGVCRSCGEPADEGLCSDCWGMRVW